jgi:hypothetical protein
VKARYDELEKARAAMPPDPEPKIPVEPEVTLTHVEWVQRQVIVFVVGLAIGIFALWQVQEVRRRRQPRASAQT